MIEVGQIFKSYRDLCAALVEPVFGGNAKQKQLREWSTRFSFKKVGNSIIITGIVEQTEELSEAELLRQVQKLSKAELGAVLLATFCHKEFETSDGLIQIVLDQKELDCILGLVNENFRKFEDIRNSVPEEVKSIFYDIKYQNRKVIDLVLKCLEDLYYITSSQVYLVCIDGTNKIATPEQTVKILEAYTRNLNLLNVRTIREVKLIGKLKEFYWGVARDLEFACGITNHRKAYSIISSKELTSEFLEKVKCNPKLLEEVKKTSNRKNTKSLYLRADAKNRYSNVKQLTDHQGIRTAHYEVFTEDQHFEYVKFVTHTVNLEVARFLATAMPHLLEN